MPQKVSKNARLTSAITDAGRGPAPPQHFTTVVGQVPDLPGHFFTPSEALQAGFPQEVIE
jgi:hypothetical protein